MSPALIAILVTAGIQTAMLIAALVMLYRQGKVLDRLDVNDKVLSLQNRQVEDGIKKANELIREELIKAGKGD